MLYTSLHRDNDCYSKHIRSAGFIAEHYSKRQDAIARTAAPIAVLPVPRQCTLFSSRWPSSFGPTDNAHIADTWPCDGTALIAFQPGKGP